MRAVAVLFAVLLAVAGCSETSTAPEKPEKETAPPERSAAEPTREPVGEPTATASTSTSPATTPASVASAESGGSVGPDMSRFNNFQCRMNTYALEQGMDTEESEAFGTELGNRLVDDTEAGGDKDLGDVMDDMGVPSYEEECGTL